MLEFNAWFFVLLVNFLVLLYLLNVILYRPLMKVFEEREGSTKGYIARAKEMEEQRKKAEEEMRRELSEAAAKAKEEFEAMRGQGAARQQEMLAAAGHEASAIAEKARQQLRAEADKARAALRGDVERFSEDIVRKLVGV
ncbi:MAG: hypothetical protein Kow0025_10110 [Thermodesulfovibrionales bacterium]